LEIAAPSEVMRFVTPKGSVAVDGVSLTVVEVGTAKFSVQLIPHTLEHTTLGFRQAGDAVNLEADILGKYVWRLVQEEFGEPSND
jgi:riboflavin synthase